MKLFDPNNLFNNYEKNGCSEPLGNDELFEEKKKEEKLKDEKDEQEGKEEQEKPLTEAEILKLKVEAMDPVNAA